MTEKRYYYTDPLAAAWMAKHHGMRFEGYHVDVVGLLLRQACWNYIGNGEWGGQGFDGFTIAPDSLHLLEPKVGDLIKDTSRPNGNTFYQRPCGETRTAHTKKLALDYLWIEVLQRQGKPFHWPESEEL